MKRHLPLVILLCICLLFGLTGCDGNDPPVTTVPTTAATTPPTTEATLPPPDALAIYADAVAALPSDLSMEISYTQEVSVGEVSFTSSSQQSVTFLGLGTDDLLAEAEEDATYGDYTVDFHEVYAGGTLYATVCGTRFSSQLTAEEYTSRYVPAALMDASLYTDVTIEGDVITFSQPTALESWILDEEVEILDASGSVTLADSSIASASYSATYTVAGSTITVTVEQTLSPADAEITAPENADRYAAVENCDAPRLLDQAYGYLQSAVNLTATSVASTFTQGYGYMLNTQLQMDAYRTGESPMFQLDQSIFLMDYTQNESQSMELLEVFRDGKYTSTQDDQRPVTNSAIKQEAMETYFLNTLTENVLQSDYLATADAVNLGSLYLAEFTGTESLGEALQDDTCLRLFGYEDALNELASAYRTEKTEYYVAVDKYTGLPTAMGIAYEGYHTVDGVEYALTYQIDYSYDLAGLSAYHNITEELPPEEEPENKATPLFYHVTGTDGQEMWLFGTIHVGDARTAYLPQEIYDALLGSVALAVECDVNGFDEQVEEDEELQEKVSELYYYSDGTTIADHLDTEDLYEDALKVMKATGSYFFNSNYQKASLWGSAIDNFYLRQGRSLDSEKGIENRLEKIANENDIPLWEVESSMFQIEMQTGYSEYLQEFQLYSSVYADGKASWESTQELYELWCAGDEAALTERLAREAWEFTEEDLAEWEAEEELDEEDAQRLQYIRDNMETINAELEKIRQEYVSAMETDRNNGMLEVAKGYLESGDTVFLAVGLAHLLAEDGLVTALREAGYTVELVTYN